LEKDITPHIPVWERYERTDGLFSRLDFTYDAERDVYICPNGQFLRTTGTVHDGRARGAVAGVVGIEVGVVSGVFNLESSGVDAPEWRPRHEEH
jgi:hypothetical protein